MRSQYAEWSATDRAVRAKIAQDWYAIFESGFEAGQRSVQMPADVAALVQAAINLKNGRDYPFVGTEERRVIDAVNALSPESTALAKAAIS